MEPKSLLLSLLPIFSLIISPSATAVSVPTAAPSPSHGPSSMEVPTPSENYISIPPSSGAPSQSPSSPAYTNNELERICKSTDYPDLCVSAISPLLDGPIDPEIDGRPIPETVVGFAIKAAMEHVKSAASLADKLASTPSPFASIFADCKDSYDDALENFEDAVKAIEDHDVGTMNSMLSAAITDFSDSEDALLGKGSPLSDMNSALVKLTSNCLAIGSLIN